MGAEKTAIRAHTLTDVGAVIEDTLEKANTELHTLQGGVQHVRTGRALVLQFHKEVEDQLDAGKLAGLEQLEVASALKHIVTRAHAALEGYEQRLRVDHQTATGKVQALRNTVDTIAKLHKATTTRLEAELAGAPSNGSGNGAARVEGQHPGATLKERRQAEEASAKPAPAKKAAKKAAPAKRRTRQPRGKAANAKNT